MKALSEMISFWDGRGPSKKRRNKKIISCLNAILMLDNNQLNMSAAQPERALLFTDIQFY